MKPGLSTRARLDRHCRRHPRDYRDGGGLDAMLVGLGVVLAFGALLLLAGVR